MDVTRRRVVSAEVSFRVDAPAAVVLQVQAAASAGEVRAEQLCAAVDGQPIADVTTIDAEYGGKLQQLTAPQGLLTVSYRAELEVTAGPVAPLSGTGLLEQHTMLRPSRYCPSDHVSGLAVAEFGQLGSAGERARAVAAWIHARIDYVSGASGVHDSAEDTVLTGAGVCRDFAHLGIVLCRALNVPARFAAVYAPGLNPMDFHAVFEAWHDEGWWAYDATGLAPRQTLVRVATGRDAADASFATVTSGTATLVELTVTATSGGVLPADDHRGPVAVA